MFTIQKNYQLIEVSFRCLALNSCTLQTASSDSEIAVYYNEVPLTLKSSGNQNFIRTIEFTEILGATLAIQSYAPSNNGNGCEKSPLMVICSEQGKK